MPLKCVIIDDEKHAIDVLSAYIERIPDLFLYKTFNNPLQAITELENIESIDLLLLDIDMPDLSGIELAKILRSKTKFLIFTSGHESYALDAFNIRANQYLLKPFTFEKFSFEIDLLLKANPRSTTETLVTTYIKGGRKNNFIPINLIDISYVEALKNYVKIFLKTKNQAGKDMIITYLSISDMERNLDPHHFIRISRSYIVSKSNIKEIDGNSVLMHDGVKLELAGQYKAVFLKYIQSNFLVPLKKK